MSRHSTPFSGSGRAGQIDLHSLRGFSNAAPPAADWVSRDRAAAIRADQRAAAVILFLAAALLAAVLFLPEPVVAALMRGTF